MAEMNSSAENWRAKTAEQLQLIDLLLDDAIQIDEEDSLPSNRLLRLAKLERDEMEQLVADPTRDGDDAVGVLFDLEALLDGAGAVESASLGVRAIVGDAKVKLNNALQLINSRA